MTQRLYIHPDNPQMRLLKQAAEVVLKGGVIIYPTDSAYAIGFHMGDKEARERVTRFIYVSFCNSRRHYTCQCDAGE